MAAVLRAPPLLRRARWAPMLLSALLIGGVLAPAGRAAAHGPPAAELVAAVTTAYPPVGTVAVAVARQPTLVVGPSIAAAEARAARDAGYAADNGEVANRPFPTASMVKLFL